ncbi:tRNA (adenosine(37)-N6)-threonylcarbamoyltransferase complex transferase subunit TsaD [bacterium]|nr:tRNA (adenosine(37)-N6)-threonylcarbamoyltransferase complex transferase subunit TsaD [bacterium]
MNILGIESSCDDTSAAVVRDGREALSNVVARQDELHEAFGGVVPELASRRHLELIDVIVTRALGQAGMTLDDIDAVAVALGPGLVGSLLAGLNYAKGLAFARGLPFLAINHVEAHLFAARLGETPPDPPFVGLVVSGGHTNLYLAGEDGATRLVGKTVDDAAGECLDKIARHLGLGFPGGAALDALARDGDPKAVALPRPKLSAGDLLFSFSGLKTAARRHIDLLGDAPSDKDRADLAASVIEAVCDVLVAKTVAAARAHGAKRVVIAGGVAANSRLREAARAAARAEGFELFVPPLAFCTDNAAMIAAAAFARMARGEISPWSVNAFATLGTGM